MAQSALVSFVTCHDGIGRNNVISSARVVRWDVNDDRDRSIFPFFRRFLVEKKPRQDGERWPTPTGGAPSFSVLVSFKDPSLCLTEKTAAHQTVELWIPQRLSGLIPFFRFFGRHPFNCQPSSWNDSMVHVARDLGGCCDGSRNGSTSCGVPALEDSPPLGRVGAPIFCLNYPKTEEYTFFFFSLLWAAGRFLSPL